jgi:predicted Zn-dependent protease
MKTIRALLLAAVILAPVAFLAGCQTDPVTGKKEFNMFSLENDITMGQKAMLQFVAESEKNKWMPDDAESMMMQKKCEEMMTRIARVTDLPQIPWKIYYTKNPTPNAFALPGGQIMVFQGLFKKYNPKDGMIEGDEELAAVLGHEMAHVCARHGTEMASKGLALDLVAIAAQAAAGSGGGASGGVAAVNALISVLIPVFSRSAEEEADRIGTTYMAMAGYNPSAAVAVWVRGAAEKPQQASIFDTHPTNAARAEYLSGMMPVVNKYYADSLAGKDYSLAENRKGLWYKASSASTIANAQPGIPAEYTGGFSFAGGTLDTTNFWWDTDNGRLLVRAQNNTDRVIKEFTLKVTFLDPRGEKVNEQKVKVKSKLDVGKYVDVAVPVAPGSLRAEWTAEKIKFE